MTRAQESTPLCRATALNGTSPVPRVPQTIMPSVPATVASSTSSTVRHQPFMVISSALWSRKTDLASAS